MFYSFVFFKYNRKQIYEQLCVVLWKLLFGAFTFLPVFIEHVLSTGSSLGSPGEQAVRNNFSKTCDVVVEKNPKQSL